jgi:phosphomannomutase/phosphoglucomutase
MPTVQTYLAKLQTLIQSHPWKVGAVLCTLLAFWFGFNGLDVYSQNKTERDVLAARDKAVKAIAPFGKLRAAQMLTAQKQVSQQVLASGQENIRSLFIEAVKDAELVEVHPVDLTAAYQNPVEFGAGKLAVLVAASMDSWFMSRLR